MNYHCACVIQFHEISLYWVERDILKRLSIVKSVTISYMGLTIISGLTHQKGDIQRLQITDYYVKKIKKE